MFTIVKQKVSMNDSKLNNQVVARIAKKIRTTRLEKKLTIQQLAARTKVSKGLLSKIENSRTIPSLPVFVTLIESLDISLKEFFDDMALFNGLGYLLIKNDQRSPTTPDDKIGFTQQHILSQHVPGRTMETTLLEIAPGGKGAPLSLEGFSFIYMISGACSFHINGEVVILEVGDAIYFEANFTQLLANTARKKATMLSIQFALAK